MRNRRVSENQSGVTNIIGSSMNQIQVRGISIVSDCCLALLETISGTIRAAIIVHSGLIFL